MRVPRIRTIATTGVFHKMWKGHNDEYVFVSEEEKHNYLGAIADTFEDKIKKLVLLHGYCLMGNHTHEVGRLVATKKGNLKPGVKKLGDWMRNGHSRFGQGYNKRHNRKGKVAYDRPKTQEIKNEFEVLRTMFYADANPVKAGIVTHPSKYAHSSYNFYAFGKRNEYTKHLTPPRAYIACGKNAEERRKKYRQMCDLYLRQKGLIQDRPEESEHEQPKDSDFDSELYGIRIRGAPPPIAF